MQKSSLSWRIILDQTHHFQWRRSSMVEHLIGNQADTGSSPVGHPKILPQTTVRLRIVFTQLSIRQEAIMRVLKLDINGVPESWVILEDAVGY